jgi:hypothetical protein
MEDLRAPKRGEARRHDVLAQRHPDRLVVHATRRRLEHDERRARRESREEEQGRRAREGTHGRPILAEGKGRGEGARYGAMRG